MNLLNKILLFWKDTHQRLTPCGSPPNSTKPVLPSLCADSRERERPPLSAYHPSKGQKNWRVQTYRFHLGSKFPPSRPPAGPHLATKTRLPQEFFNRVQNNLGTIWKMRKNKWTRWTLFWKGSRKSLILEYISGKVKTRRGIMLENNGYYG